MEHEWLMGRDGDGARQERLIFESLLDAVIHDARQSGLAGHRILHLRIEAKQAQARLLQQASFLTDPRRARLAATTAQRQIAHCRGLVTG